MQASDDGWDWKFTDPVEREYEKLQPHEQERIVSKLDEIVTDQWREPSDYLEPLAGAPHSKLRIGAFRLGCEAVHGDRVLWVYAIEKRSGAYKPDDDRFVSSSEYRSEKTVRHPDVARRTGRLDRAGKPTSRRTRSPSGIM